MTIKFNLWLARNRLAVALKLEEWHREGMEKQRQRLAEYEREVERLELDAFLSAHS